MTTKTKTNWIVGLKENNRQIFVIFPSGFTLDKL